MWDGTPAMHDAAALTGEATRAPFGTLPDGRVVEEVTLSNGILTVRIIAWGALTPEEARAVRTGYAGTVEALVLRIPAAMSPEHRETAALLARHFARLTSADLAEIRERIVRRGLDAVGDPV